MSEFQDHESINLPNTADPMTQLEGDAARAVGIERVEDDFTSIEQGIHGYSAEKVPSDAKIEEFHRKQTGRPVYIPNTTIVDAVSLSKAQGRFINAQTRFLMYTDGDDNPPVYNAYLEALSTYSRAQTDLIMAMQTALHQAGVI